MESKPKNRGWVKDAAIVFLVILLILTFFSNTIMNRNLTEVATEYINSGTISAKVRGTGKVEANGSYAVKMEKSREVGGGVVREGDVVEADQVLFILGEGSADEIEQAQNVLRQLELSYKTTAIGMESYDDSMDNFNLKQIQERIDAANAKIDAANIKIEKATEEAASHTDASPATIKAASDAVDKAMADMNEKSQAIADKETECDEKIQDAKDTLEALNLELANLDDEFKQIPTDDPEYDAKKATYETKKSELTQKISEAKTSVESQEAAKVAALEPLQTDFAAAQQKYTNVKAEYDKILASAGEYLKPVEEAQAELAEAQAELIAAQKEKEKLEIQIQQNKKSVNKSAAMTSAQLQDLKVQIEQAKAKLEELTGGVENEIRAKVSGTIDSIAYTAGSTVPEGDTLCTITVPDMGYNLSFSVTNDQARRLHTGDSATVTNYYWGSQITATLTGMKTDPKNPQTNKILTFNLEGDVNPGAELTITVGSKSATYDYIVPNGAVRSDSNGTFIYIIESKSSALGNRYIARRLAVEVLASDDTYSAISADIGWGEYVITTSARPLTNGEQIRIAES